MKFAIVDCRMSGRIAEVCAIPMEHPAIMAVVRLYLTDEMTEETTRGALVVALRQWADKDQVRVEQVASFVGQVIEVEA